VIWIWPNLRKYCATQTSFIFAIIKKVAIALYSEKLKALTSDSSHNMKKALKCYIKVPKADTPQRFFAFRTKIGTVTAKSSKYFVKPLAAATIK
jgi:hypothetical protein